MRLKKLALVLLMAPLMAFAGKAERDFITYDAEPAVKAAAATLKGSCGCDVKLAVKFDSFKDKDELMNVRNFANAISEGAKPYCSDAPSKAAICKMKSIEFSNTGEPTFTFKGGKGVATADSSSYPSWDMITEAVEK